MYFIVLHGNPNEEFSTGVIIQCIYLDDDGTFNPEHDGWAGTKFLDKHIVKPTKDVIEGTGKVLQAGGNVVVTLVDLAENLIKNTIGTICSLFLDLIRLIVDGIQIIINLIETPVLHRGLEFRLAYTYDELVEDYKQKQANEDEGNHSDLSAGTRDMYTDVKAVKTYGTGYEQWQKGPIEIDGDEYEFTMNTEIPVIPIDIYNMAIGDISLLDVNFLTGNENETNKNNAAWMFLRNFAVAIIHTTLYLATAILIITLIWNGIHVVKGSIDNPQAQVKYKEGLKRFCTSLVMLVGTVVIMAVGIFASNMFMGDLKTDEKELPIRVCVNMESEDTEGYSFSTNFTGYIRYMAQIRNVDKFGEKAAYTLAYFCIVVFVNLLGGIGMFLRMIVMLILAIVGPIIAVLHALNMQDKVAFNYSKWVKLYLSLSGIQVFLAIACRIILECAVLK